VIQNTQYPLKITTSGYEVIHSGIVHLHEPEVEFEISDLTFKFRFKKGTDGTRFDADIVDNVMVLTLFNFDNSLGQGKIDPVEIATLNGRKLYITFFVNTMEDNVRQFNYTFMLGDSV